MEHSVNILIKAIDAATAPITKVQKSMASLFAPIKKLQQSLKKLGDASGITKLAKSIKNLQAPLKKSWQEAGKLVKTLGLLGGGLLGGAIAGFKSLFLNVATQNEALASIQASLRGWDTEDAAGAYMRLRQAGLGTSEEDLKKLADIAGHTGKSLGEVAEAMSGLKDGNASGIADLLGGNVRQFGNYIVAEFTDAEGKLRRMAVKQSGNAAKDARALQQLMNKAVDAKGMAGGAERFGQSWQGMVQRALAAWHRFRTVLMDSGPFKLLKEKFSGLLKTFDELEASGGLQALAEEWAQFFCDAIESLWAAGKELVAWFQSDFLPAFRTIKDFLGGWGGVAKSIAAIMAGPLVLALASVAKAVLALGAAILATPVGWIMAAIAAIAGVVYLIYKNWSKITGWLKKLWAPIPAFFRGLWQKVTGVFTGAWNKLTSWITGKINNVLAAFDKGFLQGMLAIFTKFNPAMWIAEALDTLWQTLLGFSLVEAGKNMINSLWEGMKAIWQNVVDWLYDAWDTLTGWLPDVVREKLGIKVDVPKSDALQSGVYDMAPSHTPGNYGAPTGAADIMAAGAAAGQFGGGRLPEQNVRTEVVITGENLPPGISVSAPKSQADKTRLDCGYMMAGAY